MAVKCKIKEQKETLEETYYIKKNKKLHYDEKKEYEKEN